MFCLLNKSALWVSFSLVTDLKYAIVAVSSLIPFIFFNPYPCIYCNKPVAISK